MAAKSKRSHDPRSADLAAHFLDGEPWATDADREDLAQHIQDAVESWIEAKTKPADELTPESFDYGDGPEDW